MAIVFKNHAKHRPRETQCFKANNQQAKSGNGKQIPSENPKFKMFDQEKHSSLLIILLFCFAPNGLINGLPVSSIHFWLVLLICGGKFRDTPSLGKNTTIHFGRRRRRRNVLFIMDRHAMRCLLEKLHFFVDTFTTRVMIDQGLCRIRSIKLDY